jgi:hypothetical protein
MPSQIFVSAWNLFFTDNLRNEMDLYPFLVWEELIIYFKFTIQLSFIQGNENRSNVNIHIAIPEQS